MSDDNIKTVAASLDYLPSTRLELLRRFLGELFQEFSEDNCFAMSATLSYYMAFSLAPTLVIVVAIAELFFEKQAISGEIYNQIKQWSGATTAEIIQDLIINASLSGGSLTGTILSAATALIGASTVFSVLHNSLNKIWQVYAQNKGVRYLLRQRLIAFLMVLTIGVLLVSLIIFNTVADFIYLHFGDLFGYTPSFFIKLGHSAVSFIFMTTLFALIFKILSDLHLRWRDVWAGAALTTVLFGFGRWGISFYLSQSTVSSVYGAAGSLAVLLVWIYYSTLILLLGAEFVKIYIRYGTNTLDEKKKLFRVRLASPNRPNL